MPKRLSQNVLTVDQYDQLHEQYRWHVAKHFNIAQVCSTRWAQSLHSANAIAIIQENEEAGSRAYTYLELEQASNQCANGLRALGVRFGDRVAIVLPQRFETAVAHMAAYKLGAIAMPLSVLFGADALQFRLNDSGAKIALVDAQYVQALRSVRHDCKTLENVIVVDAPGVAVEQQADEINWLDWHKAFKTSFVPVKTLATDACDLIYTSGTTGPPKGALIAHSALIGNLTGFVASQNWFPQTNDVFWSPADWAWTGGLMDALLPTLYFGKPIVAWRARFSAKSAFTLMQKHRVTNTFIFPTALKIMMKAVPQPRQEFDLCLRAIMTAGEAAGKTLFEWCQNELGVIPNEMFGQTELNYVVGNSAHRWPAKPGSIGKAYPGHQVAVIDEQGRVQPAGVLGEIAVNRYDRHGQLDPVFFIGYWGNDNASLEKFTLDWCRTGDLATMDQQGYFWYGGRADDMFKAAGYRIGPGEIENCLVQHPAVANAAVVPKPDPDRGAVVKAFIVLASGFSASDEIIEQLQNHVRQQLAPYEYPKDIEFIDQLPMTTTGKVQRRVLRELEVERAANLLRKAC